MLRRRPAGQARRTRGGRGMVHDVGAGVSGGADALQGLPGALRRVLKENLGADEPVLL